MGTILATIGVIAVIAGHLYYYYAVFKTHEDVKEIKQYLGIKK